MMSDNSFSLMDLSLKDFLAIYGQEKPIEMAVENVCKTCKWNVGVCDCSIHADNFGYDDKGNGIIIHCNMYERNK